MSRSNRSEADVRTDSVIGIEDGLAAIAGRRRAPQIANDATSFDATSVIAPETADFPVSEAVTAWLGTVARIVIPHPNRRAPDRRLPEWNPIGSSADFPNELRANDWSKNPGRLIRKFDGMAEMERGLAELELAHREVDWDKLRMRKPSPFTIGGWQDARRDAREQVVKAGRVHETALEVRTIAETILANGKIGQITADRCLDIRERANDLVQFCSDNYLGSEINSQFDRILGKEQEAADALNNEIPDRVTMALMAVRQVRSDDEWSKTAIQQEIRKITVVLAQAKRLQDAGFEIRADVAQSLKWYELLRRYGERTNLGSISSEPFADHQRHVAGMLERLLEEGVNEFTPPPDAAAIAPQPLPQPSIVSEPAPAGPAAEPPEWNPVRDTRGFPPELAAERWRDERNPLTKRMASQGLAKALAALETAYNAVSWSALSMPLPEPFTRQRWLQAMEDAHTECGKVEEVHAQALRVRQMAEETLTRFRNSKIVRKTQGDLIEAIWKKADVICQSCAGEFLRGEIDHRHKEIISDKLKVVELINDRIPSLVETAAAAARIANDPPKWKRYAVQQKINDIATALSQAESLYDGGFDVRTSLDRCKGWHQTLQQYGEQQDLESVDPEAFSRHREALTGLLTLLTRENLRGEDSSDAAGQANIDKKISAKNFKADQPSLDEALTQDSWIRNSKEVSEVADSTGIAAELAELQKRFQACEWLFKIYKPNPFTIEAWWEARNIALGCCAKMEQLLEQARTVRGRVDAIRQNRRSPEAIRSLCDQVIAAADALIQGCEMQPSRASIQDQYNRQINNDKLFIDQITSGIPKLADICLSALSKVKSEEDWQKNRISQETRRITQQISKADYLHTSGYALPHNIIRKCNYFYVALRDYGDIEKIKSIDEKNSGISEDSGYQYHHRELERILKDLKESFKS